MEIIEKLNEIKKLRELTTGVTEAEAGVTSNQVEIFDENIFSVRWESAGGKYDLADYRPFWRAFAKFLDNHRCWILASVLDIMTAELKADLDTLKADEERLRGCIAEIEAVLEDGKDDNPMV